MIIKKNAIILAAGKSSHLAPFIYEKPKGVFKVKGEILIERQIKQLKEAGINDIYIIVGYMKEKFFYLEKKYNVKLIVNNTYANCGNLMSLYKAKKHLKNTYICCADQYFVSNPFNEENTMNYSYRACTYKKGKFLEFSINCSDANVITNFNIGGENKYAMVGHAYFNEKFSKKFVEYMEQEINDFGISNMFWEEFYAKHRDDLTLYAKIIRENQILEFDDISDLLQFDSEFLLNIDSDIILNICNTLNCQPDQIININIIEAGLTNASFSFDINDIKYVYRHPGGTAGNLINRETELYAQKQANKIGIDSSVIHMDITGWKISYYISNAKNCDFEKNDEHLKIGMNYLHMLHSVKVDTNIKVFDNVDEGLKLLKIASCTKGNLLNEFSDIINKIKRLYEYIKEDAKKLGYNLVLCHNDTYEPNYLFDSHNKVFLIDWEYAGLNYEANDIGCILCRYDWSDAQIERYLFFYFGRTLTDKENRFYHAFIPISAFYWFCWGLYKGSVGDDDSFFFLPSYRNMIRFLDVSLKSYESEEKKC